MVRRLRTSDWGFVGWHYKLLHGAAAPWHNRLLIRVKGLEHLPARGGFLLASNHTSWWDPIVLQCVLPRPVNWLAKKEMMSNAFNRWFFFDRGGCIPVDRNAKNPEAFAAAVRALHDERVIGIFPEGTRYHGKLGPAKTGVARLGLEAGAPVVPVALATDRFWGPGRKAPRLSERIYMNVDAPLALAGDAMDGDHARRETDRVMERIALLLDEARHARDADAPWPNPERETRRLAKTAKAA